MRYSVIFSVRTFKFGQKLRFYPAFHTRYEVVNIRQIASRLHVVNISGVFVDKYVVIGNAACIIVVFVGRNFYLYALFSVLVNFVFFKFAETIY